ncbi:hypothetical protein V8E52_009718 [Russula decolorans]
MYIICIVSLYHFYIISISLVISNTMVQLYHLYIIGISSLSNTMLQLYHRYIICISFLYHPYIICISFVYHPYIICISSLYHLYIICISFVYHFYIICISFSSYIIYISFVYHLYIICISSLYHLYIIYISFVYHLYIIFISSIYHLHIICISFVYHLYIIFISSIYHLYIICISFLYHFYIICISSLSNTMLQLYHLYIICISFVYHLYIICISFLYHLYIICISFVYHLYIIYIRSRQLESPSLPVWSPSAQARWSAPDACALELFILLYDMLFTNIQLDDFSPTLARLLERLTIEEPELNRNPAATAAAAKVKLARKAHATKMEVNGDERRWSNDMGGLNTQGPSIDATASQEPPFVFKMAQELTFSMLAHVLRSPWERERAASVAATDTQHAELVEKIQHWDGPTVEAYIEFVS